MERGRGIRVFGGGRGRFFGRWLGFFYVFIISNEAMEGVLFSIVGFGCDRRFVIVGWVWVWAVLMVLRGFAVVVVGMLYSVLI